MRRLLALAVFLLALPLSAKDPPAKKGLPASAAPAKKDFEAAVLAANKSREVSINKAAEKYAADLKSLMLEATKAGKLDDAVSLRDATQTLKNPHPAFKSLAFDRDKSVDYITLESRGYRWSDWKADMWVKYEISQTGGIICYSSEDHSKVWGYLTITSDGKSALFWVPDEAPFTLTVKIK